MILQIPLKVPGRSYPKKEAKPEFCPVPARFSGVLYDLHIAFFFAGIIEWDPFLGGSNNANTG